MNQKNIKNKIICHFFSEPLSKLRVRQIERLLNVPLPSVIKYVNDLEKEGLLKKIVTSGVVFYTADRGSKVFLLEKKLRNIKLLYESRLVDFLVEELDNPVLIVFGSYSRGEDIETSDIDLYIETASKKEVNLTKYERLLNKKIQIFKYSSIRKVSNIHLANNIINGICLNGYVEVFK